MSKTPLEVAQNLYPYTVQLRGKVSYSHISRLMDGEELRRDNERRRANNRVQMTRPYTALTITDPVIIDDGTVPDIIKQLITERINTRTNNDGTVSNVWYGTSKSPSIPDVAYGAEAGPDLAGKALQTRDTPMPAELAVGLDVTIGVKFFNGNMRPGMGMDYILLNEPVRYYTGNAVAQALAAQGVVYTPPVSTGSGAPAAPAAGAAPANGGVAPQPAAPMTPPAAATYAGPSGQYADPNGGQIAQAAAAAAAQQAAQNQAAQATQAGAQPMVTSPAPGQVPTQAPVQPPVQQAPVQTQPPVQSQAPGLQYQPN